MWAHRRDPEFVGERPTQRQDVKTAKVDTLRERRDRLADSVEGTVHTGITAENLARAAVQVLHMDAAAITVA